MVGALGVGGDAAEGFFGVDGGVGDAAVEFFGADVVGAGEGGEDAAGFEHLHGAEVDLLVAAEGIAHGAFGFGEGGGIEDDEVVAGGGGFVALEEVEAVFGDAVDLHAGDGGVLFGDFSGGFADVHGGDFGGSGEGAGLGEAALIGEAVEDAAAFGEGGDVLVVIQLIEVEAGLLAFEEVGVEGAALVADDEGLGGFAADDAFDLLHAFGFADGAFVALDDAAWLEDVVEGLDDEVLAEIHGEGEGLDDEEVAVAVDDEAGEAVGFAPDDAAEIEVDAGGFADGDGALDAAGEEVEVEILASVGEEAGGDLGLGIVDGTAEGLAADVLKMDDIAGLGIAEALLDFSGVDPEVAVEEAGAGLDGEGGHGWEERGGRG